MCILICTVQVLICTSHERWLLDGPSQRIYTVDHRESLPLSGLIQKKGAADQRPGGVERKCPHLAHKDKQRLASLILTKKAFREK